MSMRIPELTLPSSTGIGKLNGKNNERLTSGTEAGVRICDLEFVHEVTVASEMQPVETFLPGASQAMQLAMGERGSGGRVYQFDPKTAGSGWHGDVNLEVRQLGGGTIIYSGPAVVRAMVVRCTKKSSVVTLRVRALAVDPETSRVELSKYLGEPVEYDLAHQAPAQVGAAAGQANLPMGGQSQYIHVEVGNLVTAYDEDVGGEFVGLARMVGPENVILTGQLGPDFEPERSWDLPRSAVIASHILCGPGGGDARPHLTNLAEMAEASGTQVLAKHLLDTIFALSASGELDATDEGWPLTSKLRERALQCAEDVPSAQPEQPAPDASGEDSTGAEDDLPPEPESDSV